MKATCHCGAIEISVSRLPDKLVKCTCSICRRYGALWGYYTRAEASVSYDNDEITRYIWGDKVIEFVHCNTCGCITHYEGIEKTEDERLAVNFRMFPAAVCLDLPIRTFDGADTWKYID